MPAYVFTPEEALSILSRKGLDSFTLKARLAEEPLKRIAADYKIGHVRLSACARALDLYSSSKKEKIAATAAGTGYAATREREESLIPSEVAALIPNQTVGGLARQLKVSEEWLTALAVSQGLRFLTKRELALRLGARRRDAADIRFASTHGVIVKKLVAENRTMQDIVAEVGNSKSLLRFMRAHCSEWWAPENKRKRSSESATEAAARKDLTVGIAEAVQRSYEQVAQSKLESLILDELAGVEQLRSILSLGDLRVRQVVEARLGVSLADDASLRAIGRRCISQDVKTDLDSYPVLKKLQGNFSIEVPTAFSRHPALWLTQVARENKVYLDWLVEDQGLVTHQELARLFPFLNVGAIGTLVKHHQVENFAIPPDSLLALAKSLLLDLTVTEGQEELALLIDTRIINSFCEACVYLDVDESTGRKLQNRGWLPRRWHTGSDFELQVKKELESLGVEFEWQKCGVLPNKRMELDFWVPSSKVGIEVNPTFTHNSTYGWFYKEENAKAKDYHAKKVRAASQAEIGLVMLYERDLVEPQWSNVTKPFLKFKLLGADRVFYGRKVNVTRAVDANVRRKLREFLSTWHAQDTVPAQEYYSIRAQDGELLGVISFGPNKSLKTNVEAAIELKRMAFLPGVQVRYGLSKVIAQYQKDHPDCTAIYSYSRNDMGTGEAYAAAGFELIRDTGPGLVYVSPTDPMDSYSWSINSPWGAKSGVLSKNFTEEQLANSNRRDLIVNDLPHRTDGGKGYVEVYNGGSRLWRKTFVI